MECKSFLGLSMVDYLEPVGRAWRIASIVCCTIASIICLLLSIVFWTDMIQRNNFHYQGKPLWIGVATISVVGIFTAFIAWRLVCRYTAANGITILPTWFIQLCGVLFLISQCFIAYHKGNVLFLIEGVSICLAMILVGRYIAKKQKKEEADKSDIGPSDSGNSSL